jgi:hypothetical protein
MQRGADNRMHGDEGPPVVYGRYPQLPIGAQLRGISILLDQCLCASAQHRLAKQASEVE